MAKILSIQSSINGAQSVSRQLSQEIIEQLQNTYPGSEIKERDLNQEPVPHMGATQFFALRTPEEERTEIQSAAAGYSDLLINEIFDADILVIAVPFYNFSIPSTLKSWLDHISVPGKTFSYKGASGLPEGLVKYKKVYLAIAMGGVYSAEPMKSFDHTETYLRSFLGFLGMKDIHVFRTEGVAVPALREQNLQTTLNAIDAFVY